MQRMPSAIKRKHLTTAREGMLQAAMDSGGGDFVDVGTACSGSEIAIVCLHLVLQTLGAELDVSVQMRHVVRARNGNLKH